MNDEIELKVQNQKKFLIATGYWGVILFITFFSIKNIGPILIPFIIAYLIACILKYPIEWTLERTNLKRSILSIIFVIVFYLFSCLILILLGSRIFIFIKEILNILPELFTNILIPFIEDIFNNIEKLMLSIDPNFIFAIENSLMEVLNSLLNIVSKMSVNTIESVSQMVILIPDMVIKILITIIATFFITIDFYKISGFIKRQIPIKCKNILNEGKIYISETILKCIKSYIIIMCITFIEVWIGLFILGIPNSGYIAFMISLFDILPVFGLGGIMIPWAIIMIICGNYMMAVGIIILYSIITIIRQIIEPKLVGKQVGLNPVVTLMSMLVGLKLFGVIGLFGAPIILSFIKNLNDKGVIRIFK